MYQKQHIMKYIFISLFILANIVCSAQAKLGMGKSYIFSPNDTVASITTVSITTHIYNKGNAVFTGTFAIIIKLDTLSALVPVSTNLNSLSTATINPGDSIFVVNSFTPTAGTNGWRTSGNGNTIVVWPISSGIQTVDSLRSQLVILDPVGIYEEGTSSFMFYPNPATSQIYIKQPNGIRFKDIIIYDVLSQEVKKSIYSECIDIKELQSGSYWILISSDAKIYRQKLIKE